MEGLRLTIEERMRQLGLSKRSLALLLKGRVAQSTLYTFFNGASLNVDDLSWVLAALGLGVYPHEHLSPTLAEQDVRLLNDELRAADEESAQSERIAKLTAMLTEQEKRLAPYHAEVAQRESDLLREVERWLSPYETDTEIVKMLAVKSSLESGRRQRRPVTKEMIQQHREQLRRQAQQLIHEREPKIRAMLEKHQPPVESAERLRDYHKLRALESLLEAAGGAGRPLYKHLNAMRGYDEAEARRIRDEIEAAL